MWRMDTKQIYLSRDVEWMDILFREYVGKKKEECMREAKMEEEIFLGSKEINNGVQSKDKEGEEVSSDSNSSTEIYATKRVT